MDMKVLKTEKRLCPCCMEEHEVQTVRVSEQAVFKHRRVDYEAVYMYCDAADEFYMDEAQISENDLRMKDSFRRAAGLLTSAEIIGIRNKYGITQRDLCVLLGWGAKTITRYESYQVQDMAHDAILKKLDQDPEWFLSLLEAGKSSIAEDAYLKYLRRATALCEEDRDLYLRKTIEAGYAKYRMSSMLCGNTPLSLDMVVSVIRYFAASPKVKSLYKVKLMKMLWYADALSYKRRGKAMTGLVYQALPMGAVPVGHQLIIDLKGVPCEEIEIGDSTAFHFSLAEAAEQPPLSEEDREILDTVIDRLGKMTKDEIVAFMHREQAYLETPPREAISFRHAAALQI